jgi:hypothetical protein
MLSGSRDLRLTNCDIDIVAGTSIVQAVVSVQSGAGMLYSSFCRYPVDSTKLQAFYGGYSAGNPLTIGNYRSVGDVYYYWSNPSGWYQRNCLVQPDIHNQNDQDVSLDIKMSVATTTTNLSKYLQWNRINASNANLVMGKIGYQSSSANGSQLNVYVGNTAGTDTLALSIDEYISAKFGGAVSLLKGADIASQNTIAIPQGNFFHITGTTTIAQLSYFPYFQSGAVVYLYFVSSLQITHNDAQFGFIMNGGANYQTTAGEILCFVLDVDRWRQIGAQNPIAASTATINGSAVLLPAGIAQSYLISGAGYPTASYISKSNFPTGSIITVLVTTSGNVTFTHKTGTVPSGSLAIDAIAAASIVVDAGACMSFVNTGTYWRQMFPLT